MISLLSIQSHVVYGHVGNSAATFALQRMGCEVLALHSVQYSSHTGYSGWRGRSFDAAMIDECVAGLLAIGALKSCAGLLSGYIGSATQGAAVLRAIHTLASENPAALYCCDPVMGDDDAGLYVAPDIVDFMRLQALPRARLATPNGFELAQLTGLDAHDARQMRLALATLHRMGPEIILATSMRLEDTPVDCLDTLASDGRGVWRVRTPWAPINVKGAGDLLAALFFFHWLESGSARSALSKSVASVYGVIAATARSGQRELALIASQDELIRPTRAFEAQDY